MTKTKTADDWESGFDELLGHYLIAFQGFVQRGTNIKSENSMWDKVLIEFIQKEIEKAEKSGVIACLQSVIDLEVGILESIPSGLDGKHKDAWDLWDGIKGRLESKIKEND